MKIAILGTGVVARSHAERLSELGHEVVMGTRDPKKTLEENKPNQMTGTPAFREWQNEHEKVKLMTFEGAAQSAEMVFEALHGSAAVSALKNLQEPLRGKILVDIANPLDFSNGMPPFLFVCNTDSLGEQIQKTLPDTRVVKAFNNMNARLQSNPGILAGGDHHIFLCGNDADAKKEAEKIMREYGWKHVLDLGDITGARGMEMLLAFWFKLWSATQKQVFNLKLVSE